MNSRLLLTFSFLSAITLAIAYNPILAKLSLGLATPYAKPDVRKRLLAAILDGLLVAAALIPFRDSQWQVHLAAAAAYVLLKDALLGRSVGKFLCGLVVINLETGQPASLAKSISRNILFVMPGANVVAAFLETTTTIRDPQGQRLGDRFALTQVVEGFGAKDVVAAIQEWWLGFTALLDAHSPGRDRAPVRVPH
jgi:uncharacterized RDD family membrane protein YckC